MFYHLTKMKLLYFDQEYTIFLHIINRISKIVLKKSHFEVKKV